jgi:hypothetical protein
MSLTLPWQVALEGGKSEHDGATHRDTTSRQQPLRPLPIR